MVEVIQLRWVPSPALEQTEAMSTGVVQCLPVDVKRRDHGYFMVNKLLRKGVLLEDLLITPTTFSIEFGDDRRAILNTYLINPVLVAVKRQ